MKDILIFSTLKYEYLRNKIIDLGNFEKGNIERKVFPDGERYQRVINQVRNKNIVIIGGTISDNDTLEIYDLACAMAKYGAKTLTLIIPFYGYSTMERAIKPGEVVVAKTRARLLSTIPQAILGNKVIMIDLHVGGINHYFEGNIQPVHIYAKKIILKTAKELGGDDFILACADAGRAKWVESLANDLNVNASFVFKKRLSGKETEVTAVSAQVEGKNVVIYDDMIRTGGSLINAAKAYKDSGAKKISAVSTHGVLPEKSLERIKKSGLLEKIVCTDTHPRALELSKDDFLQIKSVDKIIYQFLKEDFDV